MTNLTLAPTIFHEDWWLNAAANGDYEVAEVLNGGHVVGRLPYRITRRFGMKWCTQPELTYFLGPAVNEGIGNISTRFMRRLEITRDLLRKLPGVCSLNVIGAFMMLFLFRTRDSGPPSSSRMKFSQP